MLRRNLAGVASLLAGVFLISVQDMIIKSISGTYAVSLAILLRSVVAFFVLLVIVHMESGLDSIRTPRSWQLVGRGVVLLLAYTAYYVSIPALTLAEAVALFFMAPVFVMLLSGPLLGEKVSVLTWFAALLGFAGVMLILKPGTALFEPAALLSLFSAAAYAYGMILARRYGRDTPAAVMSFYQNCTYIVVSVLFAGVVFGTGLKPDGHHPSLDFLVRPWELPPLRDALILGGSGIVAALAVVLLTNAYKRGQAAVVAPFEYTGMLWATFWGYAVFRERPDPWTVVGMVMIAGAGWLALRANRSTNRQKDQSA